MLESVGGQGVVNGGKGNFCNTLNNNELKFLKRTIFSLDSLEAHIFRVHYTLPPLHLDQPQVDLKTDLCPDL